MKILYLTKGDHVDYQDDCLFIGLRELYGENVVDYNKRHHNYTSFDQNYTKCLYGMGFSVSRILPDINVDRTDITSKIRNKYFDYIVYGSIWRYNDHIDNILKYYEPNKIIAVDGEDILDIHSCFEQYNIVYFKREMNFKKNNIYPISFSIPTSKANFIKSNKTRDVAICDPRDRSTYIYNNEDDYYQGYKESRFGVTMKKAGWDCMRHYEILGNGSIPYFLDLENCPENTMTSFPKQMCLSIKKDLDSGISHKIVYDKYIDNIENHFYKHNTTKSEASKFINTITSI